MALNVTDGSSLASYFGDIVNWLLNWDWVPIIALGIAALSLILQVVSYRARGIRLSLHAGRPKNVPLPRMGMGAHDTAWLTVTNVGGRAVTITGYGIRLQDGREVLIQAGQAVSVRLEPHSEHSFTADYDDFTRLVGYEGVGEAQATGQWYVVQAGGKRTFADRLGIVF